MENQTALSLFRNYAAYRSNQEGQLPRLLRTFLDEKQISVDTIRYMLAKGIKVGNLFRNTIMRGRGSVSEIEMDFLIRQALTADPSIETEDYDGSPEHNKVIDRSLLILNRPDFFMGRNAMEATGQLQTYLGSASNDIRATPIAIIGGGAAGSMMYAALRITGFSNVTVFEKRNEMTGIWNQPNVHGGTKNNPRTLRFHNDVAVLGTATGEGKKDGKEVRDFIRAINSRYDLYPNERIVRKIEPSDTFKHIVRYEQDKQQAFDEYPIVINCAGYGKPREFEDKERMVQLPKCDRPIAVRWQQILTREDVKDKTYMLIGLGNSTAEMLSQLLDFQKEGVNCDYRIITHYPEDAVRNPTDVVHEGGRNYRVFRDLSRPDLTGYQGDLPKARQDYFEALRDDKIIAGINGWGVKDKLLQVRQKKGGYHTSYDFHKLFVLTGYQQEVETLKAFGISTHDDHDGCIADYDGEFREDDLEAVYKGYFGFGTIMDSSHDKNCVVIPGMMFRLPDLLFTIVCRAAEYTAKTD